MATKAKPFEKSKRDVERKGGPKEGSKREEAMDMRQMARKAMPMMGKKGKK